MKFLCENLFFMATSLRSIKIQHQMFTKLGQDNSLIDHYFILIEDGQRLSTCSTAIWYYGQYVAINIGRSAVIGVLDSIGGKWPSVIGNISAYLYE